ncbi:uncharacterized protein [Venturia canescens]|uniref:uncharacterized protein n=1 Tax=Venturia canescens TaxID=32260 RepID=UPI001C9C8C4C|nr:uncharacterized protein LOC122410736 [Venturia canescens]
MVASSVGCGNTTNSQTLFDFTRPGLDNALTTWTENSDTTKTTGTSKAAFVTQKSQVFQRAVLFTLLNPKKNGAEYAAVQCDASFNLGEFNNICLRCRAQGANVNYKMLLRHKNLDKNSVVYGQVFTAPINEFGTMKLPFNAFKPYHRGQELDIESNPLDTTLITSIGLKIDKGPYLPDNQDGVAALEIDWIKATK